MAGVVWTPVAESDVDDILFYISLVDRRPATGERIYHEIRDRVAAHAAKQLPGQRHPNAPEGWLYCRHKRWLIVYQPHSEGIEVLRVVDAVRDLLRQFRTE